MINKRLISEIGPSIRYVRKNAVCQWMMLVLNIAVTGSLCVLLAAILEGKRIEAGQLAAAVLFWSAAIVLRWKLSCMAAVYGEKASHEVKQQLRDKIYRKLLQLGGSYHEQAATSEIIQVSVEGVDQLESYFSGYLPQFFYSMAAPLTLFAVLLFFNWKGALVLFLCVPLIPVSIAAVQTFAKKLLSRYWGRYTSLGDHFLENLQGLTTLKIYQADAKRQEKMNREAEEFRRITMKVLTMQLNSITIMDLVAFGGAALGIALAVYDYRSGALTLQGTLLTILLAAEFFIPMRTLGSYFHIAMNGMAASDKIFHLLDLETEAKGTDTLHQDPFPIIFDHVNFSYDQKKQVLCDLCLELKQRSFTAVVGESGCGKSTTSSLLAGELSRYDGRICFGKHDIRQLSEKEHRKFVTKVTHRSYLFSGSVRDNLLMADPDADDEKLWEVLEKVQLSSFLKQEKGLDTLLSEQGANLSGGQRQRLALARALLHDTQIYIFDEATSNIDAESETIIMTLIEQLAETKTVLMITHRLANVVKADCIYVMKDGAVAEAGTMSSLLKQDGSFARLWETQQNLENYGKENVNEKR